MGASSLMATIQNKMNLFSLYFDRIFKDETHFLISSERKI